MASIQVVDSSKEIKVFIPFNEPSVDGAALLPLIKSIPGRTYDSEKKCWNIPRTRSALTQLRQQFSAHTLNIPRSLNELLVRNLNGNITLSGKNWPEIDRRAGSKDRRSIPRSPFTDRRAANLVDIVTRQMRIRNYAAKTIKQYKNILLDFGRHMNKPLREINNEDINLYLSYLVTERKISASRMNQVLSALKFLYGELYDRKIVAAHLKRPRKDKKLPNVVNHEDILKIIQIIINPKHRLAIQLMYGSGLRVAEVVRVKVQDFDLENLSLFVRGGKGGKDRRTILSPKMVDSLKNFIENKSANAYLFKGASGRSHLSERSIQNVLKRSVAISGIKKKVTCHTLRHCFATHLLEAGVDLRYIQEFLGHHSIHTTEIYTHVRKVGINKIISPL